MEQTTFKVTNQGPGDLSLNIPGSGHIVLTPGEERTFTTDLGKPVDVTANLAGGPGEPGDG